MALCNAHALVAQLLPNICHLHIACLNFFALNNCVSGMQTPPSRYAKYASSFITRGSTGAQFCGEYNQLTSQFPGAGPCYAVWAQTYPWFYRQVFLLCMSALSSSCGSPLATALFVIQQLFEQAARHCLTFLFDSCCICVHFSSAVILNLRRAVEQKLVHQELLCHMLASYRLSCLLGMAVCTSPRLCCHT